MHKCFYTIWNKDDLDSSIQQKFKTLYYYLNHPYSRVHYKKTVLEYLPFITHLLYFSSANEFELYEIES